MILVTGGTGLIGSHLLLHLVKQGKKVRSNYRTKESIEKVSKIFSFYSDDPNLINLIDWQQADITDISSLECLFNGVDQVYHCAALISFDPKDYKKLERTNVEGTANVVNLCLKYGIKKLCYISSIAAIGPSLNGQMVTEETEWNENKASVYGLTKYNAELEVWRGSQEGLSVVIVNPGVVVGPGFWRSGSGSFFTYVSKEKKYYIPCGTGFVTVKDVVNAMCSLMDSEIQSERYILVSKNLTYLEFFTKIAHGLGVKAPEKEISRFMLECFWRLDWFRSNIMGKRRRLSKTMAKGLMHQDHYNGDKIKSVLPFEYESLDDAIAFCNEKFSSSRG
ncbi:NAD-dependent epimerase/dehydratase family protein [Flagellimonas zhangzhouensis]|uniref:Nucleoside-diphosphate-sugar epimerase n=1 Tax=Flagellimonas zhangzhouensis TaxID=1073328 RepID=A0A1H2VFV3_9FLAO|nr:NAD-dependent epimerase/dehydratase family protein [Allomuricauda zhangzhouensis]SDQ08130.1 Nucleoside-diphosphate-sugar epimerase [Allomuricauda zhangzhouensis]SDW67197.1 Nucleoside-diphosphate-sugar epimerase [Allomuricauda zhangzhouensis]